MVLLFIFVLFIYLLFATFLVTAKILLPWIISATLLAIVSAVGFAEANQERLGEKWRTWPFSLTIILTVVFGYAVCFIYPPKPLPAKRVETILGLALDPIQVGTTTAELWLMLPMQLLFAGLLGGLVTMAIVKAAIAEQEEGGTQLPNTWENESPPKLGD